MSPTSARTGRTRNAAATDGPSPAAEDDVTLYTPAQAARLLAVKESWLRRKAGQRAIPCTFLGKHLRFSLHDLRFITAHGVQSMPSTRTSRRYTTARSSNTRKSFDKPLPSAPQGSVHTSVTPVTPTPHGKGTSSDGMG
jgi:excisionase family DNA binding protein